MAVLGGQVGRLMAEQAPGMRLRYERLTAEVVDDAPDSLRNVDGLVMPHGFLTEIPHLDLFSDTWMCLVSSDNPRVGDALTIADLNELPWIFTYHTARVHSGGAPTTDAGHRAPGTGRGGQLPGRAIPGRRHRPNRSGAGQPGMTVDHGR
ncbi:MAG TPA: hypothetical protein VGJ44_22535 [Kribbellaceae bacterium]